MLVELEPEIRAEYDRTIADFEPVTEFGDSYLSTADVLRVHYSIANHFYLEGSGIGGIGPKSKELLESAVFRQITAYGGTSKWDGIFDITATLMFGLIKNHAFHDANKRTAFLTALYQLYSAGYCATAKEKKFEDLTVQIAENNLSKYNRYNDLVKSGTDDPEIKFISKWLRQNMRRLDKRTYRITYRELKAILLRFGFHMENPSSNYIDINKYITKKRVFGLLKSQESSIRVGRVGFHSWTATVSDGTIKLVREVTELSAKDGVDSAAFFKGQDPMQSLIATYNDQLIRLADR